MFQAKYKAHRLVNIIFYLIIFIIGFYFGFIGKKIGLENLFSKFLFIDNVSAVNNPSYTHTYSPNSFNLPSSYEDFNDSEYIYNLFQHFKLLDGFSPTIQDVYPHVQAIVKMNYNTHAIIQVMYSFSSSAPNPFQRYYLIGSPDSVSIIGDSSGWKVSYYSSYFSEYIGSGDTTVSYRFSYSYSNNYDNSPDINLEPYAFLGSFNPDFFSTSFPNFKEVCIDPKNAFVVSSSSYFPNHKIFKDFFWFGGNIIGLEVATLTTVNNNITPFESYTNNSIFLNSESKINKFFTGLYSGGLNTVINTAVPITTPYNTYDFLSYYGWSAYPFTLNYSSVSPQFPVYRFNENYITYVMSSSGNVHGGGTRTHNDLNDGTERQVCFWINNIYDITELSADEYGYYFGTIPTPDGDLDFYSNGVDTDFFGNFKTDNFGLTAIITAPLNAIRSISSGTCQPQNINILGKNIYLPCGDTIFWGREDVQTFKVFWNMFFGGILCYGIGLSIFNSVKRYKNPSDDKIEVIDL